MIEDLQFNWFLIMILKKKCWFFDVDLFFFFFFFKAKEKHSLGVFSSALEFNTLCLFYSCISTAVTWPNSLLDTEAHADC